MVIPLALALLVTGAPMGGVVGGGTVPAGEGESTGFVLLTDQALVAEPNRRNVVDHAAIATIAQTKHTESRRLILPPPERPAIPCASGREPSPFDRYRP